MAYLILSLHSNNLNWISLSLLSWYRCARTLALKTFFSKKKLGEVFVRSFVCSFVCSFVRSFSVSTTTCCLCLPLTVKKASWSSLSKFERNRGEENITTNSSSFDVTSSTSEVVLRYWSLVFFFFNNSSLLFFVLGAC